jgi:hypothetical protein
MPIALHSNALVSRATLVARANPLRMPAWPWPFWSRQVHAWTLRWLARNDIRSTGVPIWRRVFGEWSRCRRLSKKLFRESWWFSNFPFYVGIVDGSCLNTFICCEQLSNNAVNYLSTPLILAQSTCEAKCIWKRITDWMHSYATCLSSYNYWVVFLGSRDLH